MTRPISSRWPRTAAKTLFGVAVFVITIVAWFQVSYALEARRPLPGGAPPDTPCTLWFIGSSSIHRWQSLASDMQPWDARNRGVDGASVGDVSARFALDPRADAIAGIILYIGENDIAKGASPAATADAVFTMVRTARARRPHVPIFVVSMKPSPARWSIWPQLQALDAQLARRAAAHGVTLIPAGQVLLRDGLPGPFYARDGVHLDASGYRRWGGAIRQRVEATMPPATRARCLGTPA